MWYSGNPNTRYSKCEEMIIWTAVNFKELLQMGKKHLWPRPYSCPCCGGRIWGHGYVLQYFAEAPNGCWIKRYRCCNCKKIITLRPSGYWPGYFTAIEMIRRALNYRQVHKVWPPGVSRQAGGHWLRALKRQVKKMFGLMMKIIPDGFEAIVEAGKVPVSRSKRGVMIPQVC